MKNCVFKGEKGIEFDQLDRPSSASTLSSRPSTGSQGINPQNVFSQARVRMHESDELDDAKVASDSTTTTLGESYKLQGSPPEVATKLEDVVDDLPDHVISR